MIDVYATRENIGRRIRKDGDEMDAFAQRRGPRAASAQDAKRRVGRRNRRVVAQNLRHDWV